MKTVINVSVSPVNVRLFAESCTPTTPTKQQPFCCVTADSISIHRIHFQHPLSSQTVIYSPWVVFWMYLVEGEIIFNGQRCVKWRTTALGRSECELHQAVINSFSDICDTACVFSRGVKGMSC